MVIALGACAGVAACAGARPPDAEIAVVTLATATPVAVETPPPPAPTIPPSPRPHAAEPAEAPPVEWTEQGAAPKGTLRLGKASAVPELPDLATVLVALRPRLLRCVDHAARRDAKLAAPLVLELRVGARGEIVSVKAQRTPAVPAELSACLEAQMLSAHFAPPQGGGATLTIPLSVSAQ